MSNCDADQKKMVKLKKWDSAQEQFNIKLWHCDEDWIKNRKRAHGDLRLNTRLIMIASDLARAANR